jgi:hypothetical protein
VAPFPCPLLQIFWICSPCTISSVKLTFVLFVCCWLREKAVGTSDLRWYDARSGADSVFAVFGRDRRLSLLAGREAKIQFVELHANADRSSILTMCRPMEGYPANKDLKTQYEWAKGWNKKRFRELGWDTDSHSDSGGGAETKEIQYQINKKSMYWYVVSTYGTYHFMNQKYVPGT